MRIPQIFLDLKEYENCLKVTKKLIMFLIKLAIWRHGFYRK